MEDKKYWIWLSRLQGIGSKKIRMLLDKYETPERIWKLSLAEILSVKGIGTAVAEIILAKQYREDLERYLEYMQRYQIDILLKKDKEYPETLKQIYDPPSLLYIKGNKNITQEPMIAMVGCRDCSEYGRRIAEKIAFDLAQRKIGVISGMAKGIDAYSHLGCLKGKGNTIAVLGSGIDRIYPKENMKLYDSILKNGGTILSEYIIGTPPHKMHFPARNRIVSGISNGVIVVEAKEKSGTLITVDFALEQGKEVFVVPGNIDVETSRGTNELLKQGAKIVTQIEDVLGE